jgi:hypothetical protein
MIARRSARPLDGAPLREVALVALALLASVPFAGCTSTYATGPSGDAATTATSDATTLGDARAESDAPADDAAEASASDALAGDADDASEVGDALDDGAVHTEPPPPGPAHAADGTVDATFAITKLYLGDTDPDGTADLKNGWQHFGFDLDGKISSASSTDLCQPAGGAAPLDVYPDGNGGIDNAFGHLVLPALLGIASDFSSKVNAALASGGARPTFTLTKFGSGTDYAPLASFEAATLPLGAAPKYDGTDVFSLDPTDFAGTGTPPVGFASAYVTSNVWVSGPLAPSSFVLELSTGTGAPSLRVAVTALRVSLPISADHRHGVHGTLAGIVSASALAASFRQLVGALDPALCSGATVDSIAAQVQQAADILQDGTQDPAKTCDGISFGFGFDAERVSLGPAGAAPTRASPCP